MAVRCRSLGVTIERVAKRAADLVVVAFVMLGLLMRGESALKMSSRSSEHYHCTSFDYLGFTFRPRATKDKRNNVLFTSYLPAISKKSVSSIHETIKSWNLKCLHNRSLRFVASYINDVVRGWINYYGKFGKTEFWKVMFHLNRSIAYWAKTKYKRLRRRGVISAHYWLAGISQKAPNLFYHWQVGYVPYAHRKK
ncbi:group II intron maturase-specific domain-containing protein [Bacteroides sp. f07]|uniref:group II intron maturase-specific domain-containing protein n=1 Tax=Bacteroides sp. f07 TaxID=3132704 RepID=UPI0036F31BCF